MSNNLHKKIFRRFCQKSMHCTINGWWPQIVCMSTSSFICDKVPSRIIYTNIFVDFKIHELLVNEIVTNITQRDRQKKTLLLVLLIKLSVPIHSRYRRYCRRVFYATHSRLYRTLRVLNSVGSRTVSRSRRWWSWNVEGILTRCTVRANKFSIGLSDRPK